MFSTSATRAMRAKKRERFSTPQHQRNKTATHKKMQERVLLAIGKKNALEARNVSTNHSAIGGSAVGKISVDRGKRSQRAGQREGDGEALKT